MYFLQRIEYPQIIFFDLMTPEVHSFLSVFFL